MGSDEKKKRHERFLLDRFLENIGVVPEGIDQRDPPDPDFLIDINEQSIGIELTEIFIRDSKSKTGSEPLLQAVESNTDEIVSKARAYYFERYDTLVMPKILFSRNIAFDKSKRNEIASLLAEKIKHISSQNLSSVTWKPELEDPLYETISLIVAHRVPEERFARWTVMRPGIVANLTLEHLQNRIDEKAKKIRHYKKNKNIGEVWLLIMADRQRPSQKFLLRQDLPLEELRSPFTRTFYYCYGSDESVVEIRPTIP